MSPVYTSEFCVKRCTSLRDQYSRLKRLSGNQISEKTIGKSKWALTDELRFLDQFIKKRRYITCMTIFNYQIKINFYFKLKLFF